MSGSTVMSAPGRSRRTTYRCGPTWTSKRDRFGEVRSVPAALHPVLEHLQGHGAIVIRSAGDRAVVAFLDPTLVRTGVLARKRQPHQATRALRRDAVAIEQHLPEHRLRLVLALLRRKAEPARAIGELARRRIGGLQVEPGEIILRVGIS